MRSIALPGWRRTMIALLAFGISFGYVEAAIVDYLGVVYEPARQQFYPKRSPDDVFPLLTLDQIRTRAPEQQRLIGVEVAREVATIVMLAAIAAATACTAGEWAAAFAIVFGVWDICFYLFLKLLLDWPASVLTWDLLFLVPVPWAAPVLAPVLVSASMIAAGGLYLWRKWAGAPVQIGVLRWLGICLGAFVVVMAFVWDYRNVAGGGTPRPFQWGVFVAGEAIGVVSFLSAVWRSNAGSRAGRHQSLRPI